MEIIKDADQVRENMRTFKLDRFEKATLLDKWYKLPADLKVNEMLDESFGIFFGKVSNFKIKISPRAAIWVQEDPWHPEQQVRQLKDGWIELTVKAAHEMEIIPRVLQLGENAELISPKSARQYLAQVAQKLAATYGA